MVGGWFASVVAFEMALVVEKPSLAVAVQVMASPGVKPLVKSVAPLALAIGAPLRDHA